MTNLTAEELDELTKEINAVLEKYDCDMVVEAKMQIVKRNAGNKDEIAEVKAKGKAIR